MITYHSLQTIGSRHGSGSAKSDIYVGRYSGQLFCPAFPNLFPDTLSQAELHDAYGRHFDAVPEVYDFKIDLNKQDIVSVAQKFGRLRDGDCHLHVDPLANGDAIVRVALAGALRSRPDPPSLELLCFISFSPC
jgi:hypothetical protein